MQESGDSLLGLVFEQLRNVFWICFVQYLSMLLWRHLLQNLQSTVVFQSTQHKNS